HDVEYVKHAARIGAELGADIVKTSYTGDPDSFKEVIAGCPVPVVIAGGPQMDTEKEILQMVTDALSVGCKGVAMGRNVFQADDPTRLVNLLSKVIHGGMSADEALED
ncbi:MAG: fructose-bisphosphate aldolase, partial [Methanococcoides sp.]|nr:fructose-bisphosphate aldolase [Methanococcoides sp.]